MKLNASYIEAIIWRELDSDTVISLDDGDFVIFAEVSQRSGMLAETMTGIVNHVTVNRKEDRRWWRVDYDWTEGAGGNCFVDSQDVKQALAEGYVYMYAILQKSKV